MCVFIILIYFDRTSGKISTCSFAKKKKKKMDEYISRKDDSGLTLTSERIGPPNCAITNDDESGGGIEIGRIDYPAH